MFESFELENRLDRVNEVPGSNSTYTFGPLMETDNGIVLRCTSSGLSSANSTVSIGECLYYSVFLIPQWCRKQVLAYPKFSCA